MNSANNGPYGDAIQYELIPAIEKEFRGLGTGWSRFVYGGSTGGWEAMAVQMFYPDDYNGAWIACPDPIDFRHYETVDIYKDKNAYFTANPFKRTPRPGHRNWLGHVDATIEEQNRYESTLGTRGRSGDQWDAWESVFSPLGADGYPRRIWDRETGEIDPVTAAYWREHYDLAHILRRDWATLGPKLRGKAAHLRRRHGQLLPQQRRLRRRGVPEERRIRRPTRSSNTATAPSIAGTAITRGRTPTRDCGIRRWCCPGSSTESSIRRRPERTSTAGGTDMIRHLPSLRLSAAALRRCSRPARRIP